MTEICSDLLFTVDITLWSMWTVNMSPFPIDFFVINQITTVHVIVLHNDAFRQRKHMPHVISLDELEVQTCGN